VGWAEQEVARALGRVKLLYKFTRVAGGWDSSDRLIEDQLSDGTSSGAGDTSDKPTSRCRILDRISRRLMKQTAYVCPEVLFDKGVS